MVTKPTVMACCMKSPAGMCHFVDNAFVIIVQHLMTFGCFFILQGLKFSVVPSTFEENLNKDSFSTPLDYVTETAKQKTLEVTARLYGSQVRLSQSTSSDI